MYIDICISASELQVMPSFRAEFPPAHADVASSVIEPSAIWPLQAVTQHAQIQSVQAEISTLILVSAYGYWQRHFTGGSTHANPQRGCADALLRAAREPSALHGCTCSQYAFKSLLPERPDGVFTVWVFYLSPQGFPCEPGRIDQ